MTMHSAIYIHVLIHQAIRHILCTFWNKSFSTCERRERHDYSSADYHLTNVIVYSLAPVRFQSKCYESNFPANFTDWWLKYLL